MRYRGMLSGVLYCFCLVSTLQGQSTQATGRATAVPRLIRLTGSSRLASPPPQGAITATFSIYREQDGGSPLWSEVQNIQLDRDGNYTVLLGATKDEGVPVDLFATTEPRWLEVRLGIAGGPTQERVLMGSVPYALKASDADTLGGLPASAYLRAESAEPMSAEKASAPRSVGSTAVTAAPNAIVERLAAVGAPNCIAMFTSSTDLGCSGMNQNGNTPSIGIGTIPNAPIDIVGAGGPRFLVYGTGGNAPYEAGLGINMGQGINSMGFFMGNHDVFTVDAASKFENFPFPSGYTTRFLVNGQTGNVGIGTTTPAAKLEVNGNVMVDGNINLSGTIQSSGTSVFQYNAENQATAVGPFALASNTNGAVNAAFGYYALNQNTTGGGNVAVGNYALSGNQTGNGNTAVGTSALSSNNGNDNTAVGNNALASNLTGTSNTALGSGALSSNRTGSQNTAGGLNALRLNSSGLQNTAFGEYALSSNTTANGNTAVGWATLSGNTTGDSNSALGTSALGQNTTGALDTAVGNGALLSNTTGVNNTAVGAYSLSSMVAGGNNVAVGTYALHDNAQGQLNTAVGSTALQKSTGGGNTAIGYNTLTVVSGGSNTAVGLGSLHSNVGGNVNAALGFNSLGNLTSGDSNIAIGGAKNGAGSSLVSGSNNIYIGNVGGGSESGIIRIGENNTHTQAVIQGIWSGRASGSPVVVAPDGTLGTTPSSRRYKEDIRDMGDVSSELMRLRPVTFRYKLPFPDGTKPVQYGLIAEEVDQVDPDLVVRSADGQIEAVKYQLLDPLLLNEFQRQERELTTSRDRIRALEEQNERLQERLSRLEQILNPAVSNRVGSTP